MSASQSTDPLAHDRQAIAAIHDQMVGAGRNLTHVVAHLIDLWKQEPERIPVNLPEIAQWLPYMSLNGIQLAWGTISEQDDDILAMAFLRLLDKDTRLPVIAASLAGATGDTRVTLEQRLRRLRLCVEWRQAADGDRGVRELCEDAGPFLIHRTMGTVDLLPVVDLLLEYAPLDPCGGGGEENWIHAWVLGLAGQAENPGAGAVLERLVNWGAQLDARNEDGRTPLMVACWLLEQHPYHQDFADAVDWLVMLGADLTEIQDSIFARGAERIRRHPLRVGQALGALVPEHLRDEDCRRL